MPAYSDLPGTIAPDALESRDEWVAPGEGLVRALELRLGSETHPDKLVVAALPPLRALLAADTYEALVEELPWGLRGVVRAAEAHLGGPLPRLEDRGSYVAFVARHVQHPPERGERFVLAFLGALKETVAPGVAEAIARELPPEIAQLWGRAR